MLIYSGKDKNYADHVFLVLRHLHKHELQVDIDKCKFNTTKVKYLGMIVTTDSRKVDTKKIDAIQKWKAPSVAKDVQAFLSFANFYCCFISGFSKKIKPLNELTKSTQYTTRSENKTIKYAAFE